MSLGDVLAGLAERITAAARQGDDRERFALSPESERRALALNTAADLIRGIVLARRPALGRRDDRRRFNSAEVRAMARAAREIAREGTCLARIWTRAADAAREPATRGGGG